MPLAPPLKASDFYDIHPSPDHRTGDLWRDLPAFGLNGRDEVTGLIITPACDLANQKCEAITYLPVIPLREYLGSALFRHECWLEASQVLAKSDLYSALLQPDRFKLPKRGDVEELVSSLADASPKKANAADLSRLRAYLQYVEFGDNIAPADLVERLMKSDRFGQYIDRIVTNSLKVDLHFLPADGQPVEASAISEHGVVLFRRPMTIDLDILDVAQESTVDQWATLVAQRAPPLTRAPYVAAWPIKLSTLRGEFLGDLLSRYVSMYIRLGSTDFSRAAVERMVADVRER